MLIVNGDKTCVHLVFRFAHALTNWHMIHMMNKKKQTAYFESWSLVHQNSNANLYKVTEGWRMHASALGLVIEVNGLSREKVRD